MTEPISAARSPDGSSTVDDSEAALDERIDELLQARYAASAGAFEGARPFSLAARFGFGFLALVPGVAAWLQVPRWLPLALIVAHQALAMRATAGLHRFGSRDPRYLRAATLTGFTWCASGSVLMAVAGTSESIFWLFPVSYLLMVQAATWRARVYRWIFGVSLLPLAAYFGARGQPVDAIIVGLGCVALVTGVRMAEIAHGRTHRALALRDVSRRRAEEERRRDIAQNLHDGVGAELTALLWSTDDEEMAAQVRRTLAALRGAIHETRGEALTAKALGRECRRVAETLSSAAGVTLHHELPRGEVVVGAEMVSDVLLITTEAIRNAIQHGGASSIGLTLEVADTLRLEVRDDGEGMKGEAGIGVKGIRRRAARWGGEARWSKERGTSVEIVLPLAIRN